METSREFQCPGCKTTLFMSDAMHAMAMIHRGGGSYMGVGSTDTINCPACRTAMGVEDVVTGRHKRRASFGEVLVGLGTTAALIGGIVFLVQSCSG